ncbi:hypothetical protein BH24DEI1_BH24DEI1_00270 [soil metagenome]|jgi:hypothetical protein
MPEILPLGGPFWLSERTLPTPTLLGDPQLVMRNEAPA